MFIFVGVSIDINAITTATTAWIVVGVAQSRASQAHAAAMAPKAQKGRARAAAMAPKAQKGRARAAARAPQAQKGRVSAVARAPKATTLSRPKRALVAE